MSRVLGRALAVAAFLVLPLAGCGSSDKGGDAKGDSADKGGAFAKQSSLSIAKAGFAAMGEVKSVHMNGDLIDGGKRIKFDVRTEGTGTCGGTLSQDGGTAKFVATPDATYLQGDKAFWKANAGANADDAIAFLKGRWAKLPQADEMSQLCDLSKLLDQAKLPAGAKDDPAAKVVGVTELEGHEVVELTATSSDNEKFRFFIETAKTHRILKLVSETPNDPGFLAFDFDSDNAVKVPAKNEYVEMGG